MTIKLYNTLTRKKEAFQPIRDGKVGIYACGITVYDLCHVGHARSAVVFDVISRYLRYRGHDVIFVKNYTDVDDKIIQKSHEADVGFADISERYIREHDEDMDRLGVARPTFAPRATEHIEGMISLILSLMDKGLAYEVEGDVYYAVGNFPGYGKLSGRDLDEMMAGARVEVNDKKMNPLDFALWKASKEGEPWWESPWGKGRPGWHIECSAMSQCYLGETFDIHGGGEDLIFPHHENEIAQSEGSTGKPLARYWVHNGFVRINSEKMSKSLDNFFTIRDMLKAYHPEVLRLFLLQSHYRNPVDFSEEALVEARTGMDRFYSTLRRIKELLALPSAGDAADPSELSAKNMDMHEKLSSLPAQFIEDMDDDFNTARALGHMFEAVRLMNGFMADRALARSPETILIMQAAWDILIDLGSVLGLFRTDPHIYFRQDREREAAKRGFDMAEIETLMAARQAARAARNWKKADDIRDILAEKKITIEDSPGGTTWKFE
ncbi:MAG: cysteine--tRNA ligase [Syntrophus sp. (in: bacteria)]|nr:cysteine--tRNA ligase [Syntrophus sp. (in: bacteria)]